MKCCCGLQWTVASGVAGHINIDNQPTVSRSPSASQEIRVLMVQ